MYYFLRWTDNPKDDIRRNFSGHMQAWFRTKEEAFADYEKEKANGRDLPFEPKQDPSTGMWNSDPEWGISGYFFKDEKTFNLAMQKIKEIAWHHQEGKQQDLGLFSAKEVGPNEGYDGEELFRDLSFINYIDINLSYKDVVKLIRGLNEIRKIIRETIKSNSYR